MYFPKPSVNENDLAIIERGDTAEHSISAGQYVSWKGKLGKANTTILQGTTLDDSLFDYETNGVINKLSDQLTANIIGTRVSVTGYSSSSNMYTCPSDGYLHGQMTVATISGIRPTAYLYDPDGNLIGTFRLLGNGSNGGESTIFLRKGTKFWIEAQGSSVWLFGPLNY